MQHNNPEKQYSIWVSQIIKIFLEPFGKTFSVIQNWNIHLLQISQYF